MTTRDVALGRIQFCLMLTQKIYKTYLRVNVHITVLFREKRAHACRRMVLVGRDKMLLLHALTVESVADC